MENNVIRSDLHLCNDHPQLSVSPPFHTSNQSNDESSIMATGDNLYLRPPSTYRFTATPEASATNSSSSNSSNDTEMQLHQRSSITIINDIAQSYTFLPIPKKTQESSAEDEEESSLSSPSMELRKNPSLLASTTEPQSFFRKNDKNTMRSSYLQRILNRSSEIKAAVEKNDWKFESFRYRDSVLEPIVAFCNECRRNVMTDVVETEYLGNL